MQENSEYFSSAKMSKIGNHNEKGFSFDFSLIPSDEYYLFFNSLPNFLFRHVDNVDFSCNSRTKCLRSHERLLKLEKVVGSSIAERNENYANYLTRILREIIPSARKMHAIGFHSVDLSNRCILSIVKAVCKNLCITSLIFSRITFGNKLFSRVLSILDSSQFKELIFYKIRISSDTYEDIVDFLTRNADKCKLEVFKIDFDTFSEAEAFEINRLVSDRLYRIREMKRILNLKERKQKSISTYSIEQTKKKVMEAWTKEPSLDSAKSKEKTDQHSTKSKSDQITRESHKPNQKKGESKTISREIIKGDMVSIADKIPHDNTQADDPKLRSENEYTYCTYEEIYESYVYSDSDRQPESKPVHEDLISSRLVIPEPSKISQQTNNIPEDPSEKIFNVKEKHSEEVQKIDLEEKFSGSNEKPEFEIIHKGPLGSEIVNEQDDKEDTNDNYQMITYEEVYYETSYVYESLEEKDDKKTEQIVSDERLLPNELKGSNELEKIKVPEAPNSTTNVDNETINSEGPEEESFKDDFAENPEEDILISDFNINSEEEELHINSIEIPNEKETPILNIQKSEGDRNDVKDIESLEEELGIIDNLDLIEDELHFQGSENPFDEVNCVAKSEIKNAEDIKVQISDQNNSPNSKKEVRIDTPLSLQSYDQRTRIQQSNESFDPSTLNSDEAINYLNQVVQSFDEHSKHKNKDSLLKTIQEEENSNKEQTGIPATRFENNSIESIHSQPPDTNQLIKDGFDKEEIESVHDSDIQFIEENFDDNVEEEDFEDENNIKDNPIPEKEEKNKTILPKDAQNDLSPSEMPKMDIPELLIEDSAKPILAGKENTNREVLEKPQEKPTEYILSEMIIEYDEHYSMITVEDPNKSVVMNDQDNEYVYEEEYEYVSDQFIEEIVEYDEEYTGIPEDND